MKILILGLGHIGSALSRKWRNEGHYVAGTTTTESKVAGLRQIADEVIVARGSDAAIIANAARECDAIVITVAPSVRQARTVEERTIAYREALVVTANSAAAAHRRCIFLSSFSVYAEGPGGDSPISEDDPLPDSSEPSTVNYRAAERVVLATGAGAALRLPDIYGAPGDTTLVERVKMGIDFMGGRVPFGRDALFHRIHFEDVVSAVDHVVQKGLVGAFNVCDEETLPPTNASVFDSICDEKSWPRLTFLDQIRAPKRRISAARLYATGWRAKHHGIGS